ncbi:MAG: methylated-DNA--[Candidatus Methanomethylophilus sp.]|nr:methylated-DNA--[protein]-cysteine S-methyltransferase [Methanomethylophilus sp.]
MESVRFYDSPLGTVRLVCENGSLTELAFAEHREAESVSEVDEDTLSDTVRWLDIYFSGREPGFLPEMCLRGTDFQQRVWNLLSAIPYGETRSYGDIARELAEDGRRMSAQAVGNAVGSNPIAIIIPCHRVIKADGSLGGYAFGPEIKKRLLELER